MIEVAAEINRDELREVIRQEIDGFDLVALLGNKGDLDDSLDQRIDEVENRLDNMPDVDNMRDDISNLEYELESKIESLDDKFEELREMSGPSETPPVVDAALQSNHKRLTELEHALLCIFEYLHDDAQGKLARGKDRFNDLVENIRDDSFTSKSFPRGDSQ